MKTALVAVALGVTLVGCGAGGDRPAATPSGTASSTPARTTTVTGSPTSAVVPSGAFVTPTDLGAGWTTAPAAAPPCAPVFRHLAMRSSGLAEARGTLTETVASGVDVKAAATAWRESLRACGFAVRDIGLGDASVAARTADGSESLVVTGTEGVLVVLHAQGALARAEDELEGWADLAMGTSCVAAHDGCHN